MEDEQITIILQQAESRLKGSSQSDTPPTQASDLPRPLPKVQAPVISEGLALRQIPLSKSLMKGQTKDSAGTNWFNLPKTDITHAMKRDWQILRMRGVLDPKHQKKTLHVDMPRYSQMGRVVEGPTDFYSARLSRHERRQNLLGEVLRDQNSEKFKSKYKTIQHKNASGKKAHYQRVMNQRRRRVG